MGDGAEGCAASADGKRKGNADNNILERLSRLGEGPL